MQIPRRSVTHTIKMNTKTAIETMNGVLSLSTLSVVTFSIVTLFSATLVVSSPEKTLEQLTEK
jgi:hypothetical protein